MAISRIPIDRDTFISKAKKANFGKDEILELGSVEGNVSRILLKVSTENLQKAISSVQGREYSAKIHLYLSSAINLPDTVEVVGYSVPENWDEGLGKTNFGVSDRGATWEKRTASEFWTIPGGDLGDELNGEDATLLGQDTNGGSADFGTPYRGYDGGIASIEAQLSEFSLEVTRAAIKDAYSDLDLDVTDLVHRWVSEELPNHGIILALDLEDMYVSEYGTKLAYFSSDSHTIFKPYLEIQWDDNNWQATQILTQEFRIVPEGLQNRYSVDEVILVKFHAVPLFPTRKFSTRSLYREKYSVPEGSRWGIKDEYTGQMVVPFSNYVKINSTEDNLNYFTVPQGTLEPERFYRVLIQVPNTVGEGYRVLDEQIIFKVSRTNGEQHSSY